MNHTALSSNVDKRLQIFDRITSYLYAASIRKSMQNRAAKMYKYK